MGPPRALLFAAALSILLLLTVASFRRIWEADFFWQYRTGEIVALEGPPRIDTLCTVSSGRPWIEMRWLYCDLLYRVVRLAGFPGAVAAKWLVVLASFAFAVMAGPWRRAPVAVCAVVPVAILASTQRFFVRPELATLLFFSLFSWVAARYRRDGGPVLSILPALQVVWSNLHTLFLLGPAIVGLLLAVEAMRLVRARAPEAREIRRRIATIGVVLAATCGACLITPYGTRGIAFGAELLREIHDPVFRQVSPELAGPFAFGQHYTAVVYYEVLLGICAVCGLAGLRRLDPFWTLLLLSQLYLSLTSIRNLPLFCLAAIPFVVTSVSDPASWTKRFTAGLLPAARTAVPLLAIAFSLFHSWRLVTDRFNVEQLDSNQFGAGLARHRFAVGAARFLRENPVPGALFNSMFEGSYLLAQGVPVFIDPRLEVHGADELRRYVRMMSDDDAWHDALARFDFRTAIVDLQSPFLRFLSEPGAWSLVYFDEVDAVFVRAGTKDAPRPMGPLDFSAAAARVRRELAPPRPYEARSLLGRVDSPMPYLRMADFLTRMRRGDLAEPFARDALTAYPRIPGAHAILGQVLEARSDREGALREYEAELAISRASPLALRQAGLLQFRAGRTQPALELLGRFVEGVPNDPQVWTVLTKLHADAGRTGEALRCAQKSVELDPTRAEAVDNLGRLYGESGRLDEAIATLERGLRLDPADALAHGDLAVFLMRKGRRDDALAAVERGLELAPSDPELLRIWEHIALGRAP